MGDVFAPTKPYNPANWYWTVAGDASRAYSSAVGDYVPNTNAAFVAWGSDGTVPTVIATAFDLGTVLAPYNLKPVAADVRAGYDEAQKAFAPIEVAAGHVAVQAGVATLGPSPFNIASVQRQSQGVFRFAFIRPIRDIGYTALISCGAQAELASQATDAFTINVTKGAGDAPFDPKSIDFQIYSK
jgi:hypothetical protein